jgi:hypothetical protein
MSAAYDDDGYRAYVHGDSVSVSRYDEYWDCWYDFGRFTRAEVDRLDEILKALGK